jgi:predicted dinucleotide-binding enzyme
MKIGIVGAGHIGGTLARRLTSLGHDVVLANSRGPDSLRELAAEAGARAATVEEAIRGRDLIIVTVPMKAVANLSGLLASVPKSVPVIDTNNYYPQPRDGRIDGIETAGVPESRYVEKALGHPVIKAFNNIMARDLLGRGAPAGTPDRIALPVAGDDAAAKAVVLKLVDDLGFDAFDAGGLDESWRQQPGTPAYVKNYGVAELRKALGEATAQRLPQFKGAA